MRAILIDAYHQKMEEIVLPAEAAIFHRHIKQLLNTEAIDTIHPNQLLTIFFDPLAFAQAGIPGFHSGLMAAFPFFGNAICVGRNPITYQEEDLPRGFTIDHLDINWYNQEASEECRKKAMQIGIDNYKS
ncbi:hypothetical protein [Chitinophaga pinensis]|uniref:Uncharacterized protein n=1 Tax=Chitinophaga pinensis (strain ATCC 43595 / DSM 2588 / LMG 13176 / NBRC 15968 / NCIMB 11800 / UQM 2034) TaxID=485918 RepID=A0A979GYW1_CHIPD|nr:hypothetical protein [Chitinophaga pinensis]ACU62075.1 hypothetical protein Cpin_4634 [Chitinophaga pinensis DSM 2588]